MGCKVNFNTMTNDKYVTAEKKLMTIVKSQIRRGLLHRCHFRCWRARSGPDENRVFVGTEAITGSIKTADTTATLAFVTFDINLNGNSTPIDLDNVNTNSYKIFVNDVEATQFEVEDHVVTISHGLADASTANSATYKLKIHEELTNNTTSEGSKTSSVYNQNASNNPITCVCVCVCVCVYWYYFRQSSKNKCNYRLLCIHKYNVT